MTDVKKKCYQSLKKQEKKSNLFITIFSSKTYFTVFKIVDKNSRIIGKFRNKKR